MVGRSSRGDDPVALAARLLAVGGSPVADERCNAGRHYSASSTGEPGAFVWTLRSPGSARAFITACRPPAAVSVTREPAGQPASGGTSNGADRSLSEREGAVGNRRHHCRSTLLPRNYTPPRLLSCRCRSVRAAPMTPSVSISMPKTLPSRRCDGPPTRPRLPGQALVGDAAAPFDDPAAVDDHRVGHGAELGVEVGELWPVGDDAGTVGAL